MATKIALAGNPNSGKTTMFNALTGSSQYVGNWPGVTVEKKEGRLKKQEDVVIQDLPGIYSLSPYTLEEVVTRNYLVKDQPDAILDLVDASNIERNLYLTTQLLELGIPVVVALNMMDVVQKTGDRIDVKRLSQELGCPIVETSALKESGVFEAARVAQEAARAGGTPPKPLLFSAPIEKAIQAISAQIRGKVEEKSLRFFAIKLFERDAKVMEEIKSTAAIGGIIAACEAEMDDDSESIITNERYDIIARIMQVSVKKVHRHMTPSDKIDLVITNRYLSLPIFAAIMFLVYYLSVSTVGAWMSGWVNDVLFGEIIPPAVESFLVSVNAAEWLQSLVLDGIIGGVGAVLGFLPQMVVLFLLLAILEDCGYMARIAFILDRVFRRFGLSGKSFIPMLIGTGCGVPGIMASRTIENELDRKITIMTTTFIPCSAKLPIIALIAGAMFGGAWWVAPSAYFVGIGAIVCSGLILKKTRMFTGIPAPFVMELPPYHLPGAKGVFIHTWDRVKSFVKKAGTVIFLACGLIWFLSSFNFSMEMVDAGDSMLAAIGGAIAPVFRPLGWGDWRSAVATVTGLVAKENVVGSFGILYGFAEIAEDGAEIWATLQAAMTPMAAYSFLVFNLLCAPCFAAVGAIRREMGNWKWTMIAVGYQTMLAYCVSLVVYQLGMLVTGGAFGAGVVVAVALVAAFIWLLARKPSNPKGRNVLSAQY